MKYTLGLDIGIGSVGWAAINQEKGELIDFGVRRFEQAEEAKTPRSKRSARRTLRRKKWRKDQLINAFNDFGIISKTDIEKYNKDPKDSRNMYLNYHTNYKDLKKPNSITVYHLRQKAIKQKVSKRELLLCLYNILQARGHFLNEDINFEKDSVSFDLVKEKFYELIETNGINVINKEKFEEQILNKLYLGSLKNNELKNDLKQNLYIEEDELNEEKFKAILFIIGGWKGNISLLNNEDDNKTENVFYLKKQDELSEIESKLVDIYDCINISRMLSDGCNYPCDVDVKNFEELKLYYDNKCEDERVEEIKKKFSDINNNKKSRLRSIKNINHVFPNGLYVKEANAILNKQREYYPEISNGFVEAVLSTVAAKIPYYIGPLNSKGKNAWSNPNGIFKYSYQYSLDNSKEDAILNEFESIEKWKKAMISKCTYLVDEYALPKGSLIGEVFSILNEINNFAAERNGDTYYLTEKDKEKILNELFLKNETVRLDEVCELLNLDRFNSQKGQTYRFNNKVTLYKQIIKIIPELRLNTILEIFDKNKIEPIEEIILHINLYDDIKTKKEYFVHEMKISDDVAQKLAKLNVTGFYRISKKFIMDTPMNKNGESMMDILFSDNNNFSGTKNNQESIIYNAVDKQGNHIDFISNRYEKLIKQNGGNLSIDLLMANGKALMPISRPVVRSLNETIKVFNGCVDFYGVPERIVIETASGKDSIKDFTEQDGSPERHYNTVQRLYSFTKDELSKYKKDAIMSNTFDEYKEVSQYYEANKLKFELYVRQCGIDLYTGKNIDIQHLDAYEIDHILPRGFGDDSMDDKVLTERLSNSKKGDRLPIEFIISSDFPYKNTMTISKYEALVRKLFEMKLISSNKVERLLLANKDQFNDFVNQNLVDTRYIIKEFRSMLNAYINNLGTKSKVISLKSSFTKVFEKFLRIDKIREIGDQHHAYDAATICIADNLLQVYYPNYDSRPNFKAYESFIKGIEDKEKQHDYYAILEHAFYKAYGSSRYTKVTGDAPLIRQLKETTPLISNKIQKKHSGQLFEETIHSPKEQKENNALSILEVNNKKRNYSGIKCVAVDFYKVKGKHYAVHIPYLLLDKDYKINKDKYIRLIKEYYRYNDLLDKDGNLIEKAYRFRAYKGDIIYDDFVKEPFIFNLGSIANKLLDIKFINVFAYNDINIEAEELKSFLLKNKKLNIKTLDNKDGNDFSIIDKNMIIDILNENNYLVKFTKAQVDNLKKKLKETTSLNRFCKNVIYLTRLVENKFSIPTINEQNMITIMNSRISKDSQKNSQYYKLKYSVLGIRFNRDMKGNLIISGPSNHKNSFRKIRKENFVWTLSQFDVII